MSRLAALLLPSVLLSGCFGAGEGLDVPVDEIYFPVGLAIDESSKHLFVVSSDFDLQYNGGAIQSYRLGRLDESEPRDASGLFDHLLKPCSADQDCADGACAADGFCVAAGADGPCPSGEQAPQDRLLYPGRCRPIDQRRLLQSSVTIGAFATDAVLRPRLGGSSASQQRLFVPVRGDTTLHWLDVEDGALECGQAGAEGACDARHRAGQNAAAENTRGLTLGAEPFAIDANADGSTVVVTNQTTGTASLFVTSPADPERGPQLKFALSSDRIPSRPVGIANLPPTAASLGAGAPVLDAFLMTFRNAAQVRLLLFAGDALSSPEREYLLDAGGVGIDANSIGADSRGVAVDASTRQLAEARCGGDAACLAQAALIPLDVYVANRAPASLLIGRTRPPLEYPYFFESLPLTGGPSRVVVGRVRTPGGDEETRVFVVCFDSRRIFVYDPQRARFETEILTGRGPHAVAVDTQRSLLYVGHFTDSFVGVFSLDLASPATYGTMVGMLGSPKPPRSSK